jgi:hypothetical protein
MELRAGAGAKTRAKTRLRAKTKSWRLELRAEELRS